MLVFSLEYLPVTCFKVISEELFFLLAYWFLFKVEEAIVVALAQQRRPNSTRYSVSGALFGNLFCQLL